MSGLDDLVRDAQRAGLPEPVSVGPKSRWFDGYVRLKSAADFTAYHRYGFVEPWGNAVPVAGRIYQAVELLAGGRVVVSWPAGDDTP